MTYEKLRKKIEKKGIEYLAKLPDVTCNKSLMYELSKNYGYNPKIFAYLSGDLTTDSTLNLRYIMKNPNLMDSVDPILMTNPEFMNSYLKNLLSNSIFDESKVQSLYIYYSRTAPDLGINVDNVINNKEFMEEYLLASGYDVKYSFIGTKLSANKEFMLNLLQKNSEFFFKAHPTLQANTEFARVYFNIVRDNVDTERLSKLPLCSNPEIMLELTEKGIAVENIINPNLFENAEFVKKYIEIAPEIPADRLTTKAMETFNAVAFELLNDEKSYVSYNTFSRLGYPFFETNSACDYFILRSGTRFFSHFNDNYKKAARNVANALLFDLNQKDALINPIAFSNSFKNLGLSFDNVLSDEKVLTALFGKVKELFTKAVNNNPESTEVLLENFNKFAKTIIEMKNDYIKRMEERARLAEQAEAATAVQTPTVEEPKPNNDEELKKKVKSALDAIHAFDLNKKSDNQPIEDSQPATPAEDQSSEVSAIIVVGEGQTTTTTQPITATGTQAATTEVTEENQTQIIESPIQE